MESHFENVKREIPESFPLVEDADKYFRDEPDPVEGKVTHFIVGGFAGSSNEKFILSYPVGRFHYIFR